jgi:hypothetical protein
MLKMKIQGPLDETQMRSDTGGCEQEWRDFFKINYNALFQTALLLTADAVIAEVALTKSIEDLDMAPSPGQTSEASRWYRNQLSLADA